MQIVIDIPDKDYQVTLTKIMLACYGCRITELPKGHGRLIDADRLIEEDKTCDMWTDSGYEPMFTIETIENMPTIIEADKEGDE